MTIAKALIPTDKYTSDNMSIKHILYLSSLLFVLCACGDNAQTAQEKDEEASADSMAVTYYKLRMSGQWDDYIDAMQSCDGTPDEYKQRVKTMLNQHEVELKKERGGVRTVKVFRTELHDNGKMANVFLSLTYQDGSTEETLFPLVHDGKRWRIR